MAFGFVKKTWKDRISEYPTRRTLTKEDGSTELVTVSRSEGTVSQEGDAFSADNMNDLETRVDNALNEANSNLIKTPTTYTIISSAWDSSQTYIADEDCWLVATASAKDAEYARLQMYCENLSYYMDKEMSYGRARAMYVKLYVKAGTSVVISTEGNFGSITLYKLT